MEPQAIEENNFKLNIIQVVRGKEKFNIFKKCHRANPQKNGFGKQQYVKEQLELKSDETL